ncbi:hypothetical protein JCM13580A_40660 [Streptomyces drozdowiczii]
MCRLLRYGWGLRFRFVQVLVQGVEYAPCGSATRGVLTEEPSGEPPRHLVRLVTPVRVVEPLEQREGGLPGDLARDLPQLLGGQPEPHGPLDGPAGHAVPAVGGHPLGRGGAPGVDVLPHRAQQPEPGELRQPLLGLGLGPPLGVLGPERVEDPREVPDVLGVLRHCGSDGTARG